MGMKITDFVHDGFCKIADVRWHPCEQRIREGKWTLVNTNDLLLFSEHDSWIYCIVEGDIIKKLGETGNPLGVQNKDGSLATGTQGRLGRLCSMGSINSDTTDTDTRIRYELQDSIDAEVVSIWAKPCEIVYTTVSFHGQEKQVKLTTHKDLERVMLDHIYAETGTYPDLNKGRK